MEKIDRAAVETLKRIARLRAELLTEYPFYGRLLLHLIPSVTDCGTACTDMTHIAFDPAFAASLTDGEMKFVLLHEVMHCVLKHCLRGKTLDPRLYNVACDIVVNSLILESMGVTSFSVAGEEPMHTAPDGKEGRLYSAEEVYGMLRRNGQPPSSGGSRNGGAGSAGNSGSPGGHGQQDRNASRNPGGVDSHDIWDDISERDAAGLRDRWEARVRGAAGRCADGSGIPLGLKRYLYETGHMPRTNWKQVLAEFIRHNRADFTFQRRDVRYTGDLIMPSFVEQMYGNAVENLWFCIDASGSVSGAMLSAVYAEIMAACRQLDGLSGQIAFFDTALSDFYPFENEADVAKLAPVGGGGTSFDCIFDRLGNCGRDELPVGIIILTDGYAPFPGEERALGIPVLWVILDSDVKPDWGPAIHIRQ